MLVFDMKICDECSGSFKHQIFYQDRQTCFWYHPVFKEIRFPCSDSVTDILQRNLGQLLKVLHTKRINTFYPGFSLRFSLCEGKDTLLFNDMNKTIVLDRRKQENEISVLDHGKKNIHEIYTDGSFLKDTQQSGIATIIKNPEGKYALHAISSHADNSCLAELLAVIKGFELLKDVNEIRLFSDSRYVRKGMTEWIFNWQLNQWKTANGETARHVKDWQSLELLTRDKYIEVAWIKGHSGHFENTMCDLYARDAALKSKANEKPGKESRPG